MKMDKTKLILIIFCIILLSTTVLSTYMYKLAIKLGAKNTVTAIEMVVACEIVGNVTHEQVQEQYIKTFILNQSEKK